MKVTQEEIEKLIKEYEEYAEEHGFMLNPNRKIVEAIARGLLTRESTFGCRYCPCRVVTGDKEKDKDIICPCALYRDELKNQGYCHCRLFVKRGA